MEYFKEVGFDIMILCFFVNVKGNKSVEICNVINLVIFEDLLYSLSEKMVYCILMFVIVLSMFLYKNSVVLKKLKKWLGVSGVLFVYGNKKFNYDVCLG